MEGQNAHFVLRVLIVPQVVKQECQFTHNLSEAPQRYVYLSETKTRLLPLKLFYGSKVFLQL